MKTDRRKENLFARLAQHNARAVRGDTDASGGSPPEDTTLFLDRPEEAMARPSSPKMKTEPPKGKRGDPDYCQANAYVPKNLRRAVERALCDIEGLDYSSLVADLLREWLKSRGVSE